MRYFKFLIALMFVARCSIASAAGYYDVRDDSPWHDGIAYVTEHGIAYGTGNGRFSPDAPITTYQWATMVCRAIYGEQADPVLAGYEGRWLDCHALMTPSASMCRGVLYQSAFRAFDIQTYSYELFQDGFSLSGTDNSLRIAKDLELCSEGAVATEFVTRGEVAELLRRLMTEQLVVTPPPICTDFPIIFVDDVDVNSYIVELSHIPAELREAFKSDGWVCYVDFNRIAELEDQLGVSCAGATNYLEETIYLGQPDAIAHEFGHFLDSVLCFPEEHKQLFDQESSVTSRLLGRYSTSDRYEYFAEYFDYWIRYRNCSDKMHRLEEVSPATYQYFLELESSNWGLKKENPR